jgi:hypothetical protein
VFYLFRSRWFALIWVVLISIRVAFFAAGTSGSLAWLSPGMFAPSEAAYQAGSKDAKFQAWAEDDKTRMSVNGTDPSRPDKVRDGDWSDSSQYRSSSNSNSDSSDSE